MFTVLHQIEVCSHNYNVNEHKDLSMLRPFPEMETPHRVDLELDASSNVLRLLDGPLKEPVAVGSFESV